MLRSCTEYIDHHSLNSGIAGFDSSPQDPNDNARDHGSLPTHPRVSYTRRLNDLLLAYCRVSILAGLGMVICVLVDCEQAGHQCHPIDIARDCGDHEKVLSPVSALALSSHVMRIMTAADE